MMSKLKYTIELLAPVVISERGSDPNTVSTLDNIPGRVMLGALAAKYLNDVNPSAMACPDDDAEFVSLFLGSVRYLAAYPQLTSVTDDTEEYLPVPLYLQGDKAAEGHIINRFSDTTTMTKKLNGYYRKRGDGELSFHRVRVHAIVHMARQQDRLSGHPSEGGLFTYEALAAGQKFYGYLYGASEHLARIEQAFNGCKLGIGRSKMCGYGAAKLQLGKIEKIEGLRLTKPKAEVVINFISPAIFHNQHGYPDASALNIERTLQGSMPSVQITIEQALIKTADYDTYVGVWKLHRPGCRVVEAGSALEVKLSATSADELNKAILSLLESGIGDYTHEGFGAVSIIEDDLAESYKEFKKPDLYRHKKPVGEPPELVKSIFEIACRKHDLMNIAEKARRDAGKGDLRERANIIGYLDKLFTNTTNPDSYIKQLVSFESKATLKKRLQECKTADNQSVLSNLNNWQKFDVSCDADDDLVCTAGYTQMSDEYKYNQFRNYWLQMVDRCREWRRQDDKEVLQNAND